MKKTPQKTQNVETPNNISYVSAVATCWNLESGGAMQIASSGSLFYGLDKGYDWESQGLLRCVLHKGTYVYEWSGPRLTKVSAVSDCCGKKRMESEGKAFNLPLNPHSNLNLWTWDKDHDLKSKVANRSSWNEFPT